MKQVLDSRFLMEHYYSQDKEVLQKTSRKMKDLIQTREGIIPTIVICETVQIISAREGIQKAEMIYLSIISSGIKIEALSPVIAKEAGMLKSQHRSTPIGDCIVAATAIMNRARIVSDDPHFDGFRETKRIWI